MSSKNVGESLVAHLTRKTDLDLRKIGAAESRDIFYPGIFSGQHEEVAKAHHAADRRLDKRKTRQGGLIVVNKCSCVVFGWIAFYEPIGILESCIWG